MREELDSLKAPADRLAEMQYHEEIGRGIAYFLAWAHRKGISRKRHVSVSFWDNRAERRAKEAQAKRYWRKIQRKALRGVLRSKKDVRSNVGYPPEAPEGSAEGEVETTDE